MVDTVDANAIIEFEMAFTAPLAHGNIVIKTFILINERTGLAIIPTSADRTLTATPEPQSDQQQKRRQWPPTSPAAQGHRANHHQGQAGQAEEGTAGTIRGDQPEHRQKGTKETTGRRDRIEPPGNLPGLRNIVHRQPHRPRANRAQQHNRQAKEQEHGQQCTRKQPPIKVVNAGRGPAQNRAADHRNQRNAQGTNHDNPFQQLHLRKAIGQLTAEPRAQSQIEQNQPNQGRPDNLVVAKDRFQQARRAQLDPQRHCATNKDKA